MKYRIAIIAGGVVLAVLFLVVLFFGLRSGNGDALSGTLVVWGLDDPRAWQDIITAFEAQHGGLSITYEQRQTDRYEQELVNALAAGSGPDVFAIRNTWVSKHHDKLAPFPAEVMNETTFQEVFVSVAERDFLHNGAVWAVPLSTDTMALYYNTALFNSAGLPLPPSTWDDFNNAVERLTVRGEGEEIQRAGAGIGTANNVRNAHDILAALMMQSGAVMVEDTGLSLQATFNRSITTQEGSVNPGEGALAFYASFSDPDRPVYTWNRRMPNDISAFEQSRTAMYFGYARDLPRIQESGVPFAVAPFPQARDQAQHPEYRNLSYANYWGMGVSRVSQNQRAGWEFLSFATSRNALFSYLSHTNLPAPRRDLVAVQETTPHVRVFARQSLSAASWFQADDTRVRDIFVRMIDDVVLGRANVREAVSRAAQEVTTLSRDVRIP